LTWTVKLRRTQKQLGNGGPFEQQCGCSHVITPRRRALLVHYQRSKPCHGSLEFLSLHPLDPVALSFTYKTLELHLTSLYMLPIRAACRRACYTRRTASLPLGAAPAFSVPCETRPRPLIELCPRPILMHLQLLWMSCRCCAALEQRDCRAAQDRLALMLYLLIWATLLPTLAADAGVVAVELASPCEFQCDLSCQEET
jgi:hypothetical protein